MEMKEELEKIAEAMKEGRIEDFPKINAIIDEGKNSEYRKTSSALFRLFSAFQFFADNISPKILFKAIG